MDSTELSVAIIGYGEAGQAFVAGCGASLRERARAYDIATDDADTRDAKLSEYARDGVAYGASLAETVSQADVILSLVTAESASDVANAVAAVIQPGSFFFEMNSIAPDTKRESAAKIEAAGGQYVDVAVMSPVIPAREKAPLLMSGAAAEAGRTVLAELGFTSLRIVPGDVGRASAIKMVRSVMVKGLEALTTECVIAAEQAGVLDEVIASLNASWPGIDWAEKADYNLDRMMLHGVRRAAEMEEVVKTLDGLGTGSVMTRGTVERQRAIGLMEIKEPPVGLVNKIARVVK